MYGGSREDVEELIERIRRETKATRKRRAKDSTQEHEVPDVRAVRVLHEVEANVCSGKERKQRPGRRELQERRRG